ncbi:RNA polymerase sigma factor [Hydrogenophaga sp.]|uniref:RNA polymerase sigma factor n=1 Tax=Hydrogenophaga sp. TaxID=1904254 RepID=UPI0035AFE3CC
MQTPPADSIPVAHTRHHSPQQLEAVVLRYGRALYQFVLRKVHHESDAEDIAQQAWVEAALHLDAFRGEAELSTWVFGIAHNMARNHLARSPSRRYVFESDDEALELPTSVAGPLDTLLHRQELQRVQKAMDALSPETVQVLHLVALDGLSYEEAAAMLNVPESTLRSRVSRARATLRQALASSPRRAAGNANLGPFPGPPAHH